MYLSQASQQGKDGWLLVHAGTVQMFTFHIFLGKG